MANLGETEGKAMKGLEELKTTDIESEEADIFERKKKFEELTQRLETHRSDNYTMRGNDLRYNIYMRKMTKLSR